MLFGVVVLFDHFFLSSTQVNHTNKIERVYAEGSLEYLTLLVQVECLVEVVKVEEVKVSKEKVDPFFVVPRQIFVEANIPGKKN